MATNIENAVQGLSGHEIITDLLYQVEKQLQRDCNLTPMCCYEGGYEAEVQVKLKLHGIDVEKVDTTVSVGVHDERPGTVVEESVKVDRDERLDQVRKRSEQPIPTMTKDGDGKPVVKQRRYQQAVPHAVNAVTPERGEGGATGDQLEQE